MAYVSVRQTLAEILAAERATAEMEPFRQPTPWDFRVADALIAALAARPVSDEASKAADLAFDDLGNGGPRARLDAALAAGWRAMLGVKP